MTNSGRVMDMNKHTGVQTISEVRPLISEEPQDQYRALHQTKEWLCRDQMELSIQKSRREVKPCEREAWEGW